MNSSTSSIANDCPIIDISSRDNEVDMFNAVVDINDMSDIDVDKIAGEALTHSLNYENYIPEDDTEVNNDIVSSILNETDRDLNGRLLMPLPWKNEVVHLLGHNYNLAYKILQSTLKKFQGSPEKLEMIDRVFHDQEELKIIEQVDLNYSDMFKID